ncbi:uncharacterized protein LOC115535227 isoform X4 [Gadus morhua]|uniref:uncharacterized protein LOC115535227 isoform X4 n=1 Tax=Gadus morhua TaxID=8049 RepID=UPI0011B4BC7A|nr:uncharacterized protein LOC115535227 isoform X4 [Gadus morhua]
MSFPKLDRIGCQVCLENFPNIIQFKTHLRGNEHHKQMVELFPKGKFHNRGYFCHINVMEHVAEHQPDRMIIGLSMVTVCHQAELKHVFYLCHLCEESCTQKQIMGHLYSPAHLINYYTCTDPDVLSFSWFPGPSMFQDVKPVAMRDVKKNGNGVLQVLDLPKDLFCVIRGASYAAAMSTLEENEKLASQLKVSKPKWISVQSYVAFPRRKHALLGLQHLVECVCDRESGKKFHLCTLCQITLRGHAVISHAISFDHVYRYINAWHPSTLRSKQCYTECNALFKTSILHYARQAEERSGTNNSIKQLTVTTEVLNLLEASYSKALATLEPISRECNGRSLITSIQPGDPLAVEDKDQKEHPANPSLKLRCQICKSDDLMSNYTKHLNHWTHASEQRSIFGSVEDKHQKAGIPYLKLFGLMRCPSEEPIIGLPFIVVCICSKVKRPAGYLCFACSEYFSDTEVLTHMSSQRHALFTVLQQRVPFAWYDDMDTTVLRQLALEEQKAYADRILKVFDIPYSIFSTLKMTFYNLTRGEELRNVQKHLRNDVPCLTNPKPELPLLGQDFVVKYSMMHGQNSKEWKFLCLLCGRNLGTKESTAHVLSYEHAKNFLEKAHCGSLDCSDVSRETLLDLAEQAAERHPVSEMQTLLLDEPLFESNEYLKAVEILQRVKRRQSDCELIPVLAAGKRLVPNEVLQEIGHGHAKEEPQAESEKWTIKGGQPAVDKLHSISYTPPKRTKTEPNIPAETHGGPTGGATKEMKVTKERVSTEAPETSSKGPVKSQPETRMEVDSHPGKRIKEEPKTRDEVQTVPSVVATNEMQVTKKRVSTETPETSSKGPVKSQPETRMEVDSHPGKKIKEEPKTRDEVETVPSLVATNEMQVTKKRGRTATPETSSKGPVKSQSETSMELDAHPGKKVKKEQKTREEVETVPSVVASGQPGTPVNVKQEPENEGEEARVQVWTESSTQMCTAESMEETAMSRKRKAQGSSEEAGSQRLRLCLVDVSKTTANPSGHLTGVDDRNATEKALLEDVKPARAQLDKVLASPPAFPYKLWDFIKMKDREPVIGLHALIECHCEPYAPIYLCKSCCVKVHEKDILGHITGMKHRMRYLKLQSINVKRQQLAVRIAAAEQERRAGFGEAQVVELTPEQFGEMSKQSYDFGLLLCQNTIQRSPPAPKVLTCKPDAVRPSAAQKQSPSLALSTSSACGTGETTHVANQTKAQKTEYKVESLSTLENRVSVKGLDTEKNSPSAETGKVFVHKIGIPSKTIVEKCIPAPSIISMAPSISLLSPQTRVTFAKPLETSPKSSPSIKNTLTHALKVVSDFESAKFLGSATLSKIEAQTKGRTTHDPQPLPETKQPSLSVAIMPTSNTAPLVSDSGKTTFFPPKPKAQKTGLPENKATSSPTLNSGATFKVSRTDANTQITVTSRSVVPEIGIPAKNPVEEFIPAPFFKPVATALSISTSQSSVAVVKTPATSSKSIPSTLNTLTISSKGINASKLGNALRAVTPSKDAAPAMDQERTNPDASIVCKSTPIPHSGIFSYPQPVVEALSPTRSLLSKPPVERSTASTEQGLGSASPTTPVYSPSTFPPNHTAVADSSKDQRSKNQPVVGTGSLVVVKCEKRRQSYCLLCSVRLRKGDHMTSNSHRYKYLKFHSFAWDLDEKRMLTAVTHLADLEKVQGTVVKTLVVNGEIYNRLGTISEEKALAKVRELLESQSLSSTKAKAEGLPCVSVSHAASSTADVEKSNEVPRPMAAGSPTQALPSLPRALEEPKMHITQPDPAPRREPSPQGPVGRPTAELDHRPSANSKHNGESIPQMEQKVENSNEVPRPMAAGSQTQALPSLPRALEEPKMHITQPDPAPRREPSPQGPVGRPTAELDHRPSANSKHNGESIPQMEQKVENSNEVPRPMAAGSQTQALPSLPRALEEPKMHITQPDPAPRREPSPQGPVGRPTAELDHRPSANSKHNGESIPQMEQKGEKILGPSDLSTFLMVHCSKEPIIGLALVFECRALFEETFYLCGSCMKTFPIKLICKHIVSAQHQRTYMLKEYPHFMSWWDQDFSPEEKEGLLTDISWKISEKEGYDQMDAQVIMLRKDCYDYIRQASFIEALDTLQNISREKRPNRLSGYSTQLGPQTPETPSTRESMESNTREKDGPPFPMYSVPQDIVNGCPTLPVIGICAIVECSCEGHTPFYLCLACGNRLSQDLVLPHVKGQRHIQEYLSERYPQADDLGVEPAQLLQPARGLEELNLDEPSTMQRIALPKEDFIRIRTMTFDPALSSLMTICENQRPLEIPTRVTSRPEPAVKRHFEVGWTDADKVKRQRPLSPPADRVTPTLFPVSCPHSPFGSNTPAATVPLVSLTHEPKMGPVPSFSKDETKRAVNHDPGSKVSLSIEHYRHEESPKVTISYYPGQPQVLSSVPPASNPHAEITAEALLPQADLDFQGNLRREHVQTGTYFSSRLQQIRNGRNRRLLQLLTAPSSSPPIVSTEPSAANLGTTACSGRSASTQNNSHTHVTEETPGIPGSQGYSTGQPGYPTTPYHASGYLSHHQPPPMPTVADPPRYPTHMNHVPNQGLQQQHYAHYVLPNQAQSIAMARGLPQYWPSVTQATAWSHGATAPSYHGAAFSESAASYSQELPNAFRNNTAMSDPGYPPPQGTPNLLNLQGFQATTHYGTSATAAGVVGAEGNPQGTVAFHFSNSAGNGTS